MKEDITIIMRDGVPYAGGGGGTEPVASPDGFVLNRSLGRGGMSTVYLARRLADGRDVALKVLHPEVASKEKVIERFGREARFMMELDHPNIIKAFSVGLRENCYYLCMEYVPGETLAARIRREPRIDEFDALRMMRQLAGAVAYGARQGIVHRDLKPENMIIRDDGVMKLADLGLAIHSAAAEDLRLTAVGTTLGTPLYMSPEQACGDRDVDTRADIYSLGCTFYHALCGQPPFPGDDGLKIMRAHLHDEPPPPRDLRPDLDEGVEAVILTCMEKDRDKRYQTAMDLAQAIDLILLAAGQEGPPQPARDDIGGADAEADDGRGEDRKKSPSSRRFAGDEQFSFDASRPS